MTPTAKDYEKLPGAFGAVGLSVVTLQMAIGYLGPAFTYDLFVPPRELLWACAQLRIWAGAPLAFQVNLHEDPALASGDEFYLEANGRRVGVGCGRLYREEDFKRPQAEDFQSCAAS